MGWFSENVDGAAVATALTAVCSLLVAFVHRRGRGADDDGPTVIQGQTVDAPSELSDYLKSQVSELEAEVISERALKDKYKVQRDYARELLRANHILYDPGGE